MSKTRAYKEIFSKVNFDLKSHQLLWLKGANGSGKTSLLRILAGLSQASSGEIVTDVESFHYISHQLNLIESLTVKESIQILFPLYGMKSNISGEDLEQELIEIGLRGTSSLRIAQLSAGQRQRLKLLVLTLDYRPLWLLDEPYNNLDKNGRIWLDGLLKKHLKNNGLVIITSHDETLGCEPTQILDLDENA